MPQAVMRPRLDLCLFLRLGIIFRRNCRWTMTTNGRPAPSMFQQIYERWLKNHQTLLPGLRFRPFDFKMLLRDVNLAPRPDRWIVVDRRRLDCYEWKELRIHLRSRWPYRLQIVRLLFLSLRNACLCAAFGDLSPMIEG